MKFILAAMLLALSFHSATGHAAIKDWTLLVFVNGHNNLDVYGDADINEMEEYGSTDAINVVVQRGTLKQNTTRLYVTRDTNINKVTSPVVQNLGKKVDMGSYENLVDFIKWGAAKYPAKKYFVVIWNHGSGWHRDSAITRGISYDDIYHTHITTPQLGLAMKEAASIIGHKVDVLGMDACLMAMADVASEFSDDVEVYVGSEETEPLEGWPYDQLLAKWIAQPTMKANEVAQLLASEYIKSYQGGSQGTNNDTTLSAFDLSMLDKLERAITDLGKQIRGLNATEKPKVLKAASQTLGFYYSDYKDLGDFLTQLRKAKIRGLRGDIMTEVATTLQKFVVASHASPKLMRAKGTSVWLPTSSSTYDFYKAQYQTLAFHKRTEWGFALETLLK